MLTGSVHVHIGWRRETRFLGELAATPGGSEGQEIEVEQAVLGRAETQENRADASRQQLELTSMRAPFDGRALPATQILYGKAVHHSTSQLTMWTAPYDEDNATRDRLTADGVVERPLPLPRQDFSVGSIYRRMTRADGGDTLGRRRSSSRQVVALADRSRSGGGGSSNGSSKSSRGRRRVRSTEPPRALRLMASPGALRLTADGGSSRGSSSRGSSRSSNSSLRLMPNRTGSSHSMGGGGHYGFGSPATMAVGQDGNPWNAGRLSRSHSPHSMAPGANGGGASPATAHMILAGMLRSPMPYSAQILGLQQPEVGPENPLSSNPAIPRDDRHGIRMRRPQFF